MRRIIFFAPAIKSKTVYKSIWHEIEIVLNTSKITGNEIAYGFVPNAKDIWVRDFMPFQRHDGDFLIYRYEPDYLKGNEKDITNCQEAFIEAGGRDIILSKICHHTNLVLDGGNMIKCVDKDGVNCVIMTTKVLYENPTLSHHEILKELEKCLGAEVILIPWDLEEPYGHSDGMVRSIGNGKLLLNFYSDFDPKLGNSIKKALGNRFEISELSYGLRYRENSWCHLNYLEIGNIILLPVSGMASDSLATYQIRKFTGKRCIEVWMPPIIAQGGAMHCISWTIDTEIILENNLNFNHPIFNSQSL